MSQKAPPMKAKEQGLQLLMRLWPFVREDKLAFFMMFVLSPVGAALALSQPYIIKQVIDEHIMTGAMSGINQLLIMYLGLLVLDYVSSASLTILIAWIGARTQVRLREFL